METENLIHPPLAARMKVLNEYVNSRKRVGFQHADKVYRIAMRDLYETYNYQLKKLRLWQESKKGKNYGDY